MIVKKGGTADTHAVFNSTGSARAYIENRVPRWSYKERGKEKSNV